MTLTAAGSPLVAGGDGHTESENMTTKKDWFTALRGVYATVYDDVQDETKRQTFRLISPGEVIALSLFDGIQAVSSNKVARTGKPPASALAAPVAPPPVVTDDTAKPPTTGASVDAKAAKQKGSKTDAEQ